MLDLFFQGGPWFMAPLSILGILIFIQFVQNGREAMQQKALTNPNRLLLFGGMAGTLGVLAFAVAFIDAAAAIVSFEGQVAPAMLWGGVRVALIAPAFSMVVLFMALLGRTILSYKGA